jgi:hypothetical protein
MSIFKETFKDGVKNQIIARQEAILNRTPSSIQYFNSRNAWIRMTSAVDVGGDKGKLAKEYVLLGGTLTNLGKFGYTLKSGIGNTQSQSYSTKTPGGTTNRLGIRPMPGITSIDVKSKAAYGSLREVTVNFQCWDIRQLEELELLYMRPGYSVLIEWGWAPYLKNDKTLGTNIQFVDDVLNGGKSKEEIWKTIFTKASTDGNYEAIYGFIKNYSWNARPDGGYDCTTNIITMGEIIESLKVNYGAFNIQDLINKGVFGLIKTKPQDKEELSLDSEAKIAEDIGKELIPAASDTIQSAYSQNIIAGICAELHQLISSAPSNKSLAQRYIATPSKYEFIKYDIDIKNQQGTSLSESYKQIYIKLSDFINILNTKVLLSDGKNPIAGLSINDIDGNPLLCLGNTHQISTNPTVCLIKNPAYNNIETNLGIAVPNIVEAVNKSIKPYLDAIPDRFSYLDINTEFGTIGNIYVNLDYIYKLSTNDTLAAQDKKEKNDIILFDFIKSMMSGINTAIGNVANFDIFVDPVDSIARIIDVNYVDTTERNKAYDKAFTIQIHNLKSIVRNYKLESQIFPEQITTVAIGAQAKGGALGADTNTLIDFNQNLIDRIIPKKDSPLSFQNPTNPIQDIENQIKNLQTNWAILSDFLIEAEPGWWSKGDYDVEQSSKYANSLKDIINFFNSIIKTNTKNRAIIPTKLSLEMDGIGGMVIGNLFRIPDDLLPRGYKRPENKKTEPGPSKIAYVVTGLGHSIQNNDWVTKVDAQFIILDEPRGENKSILSKYTIKNLNNLITNNNSEGAINLVSQEQNKATIKADPKDANIVAKYGEIGDISQLTTLTFPYPMYFGPTLVKTTPVHKLVKDDLEKIFKEILSTYGLKKIKELKLDQFGGLYNVRNKRNGGSPSIHSWAIAIDLYPLGNSLSTQTKDALFAKPEYKQFIDIWYRHNWKSFGKELGYDWMHFQVNDVHF